MQGYGQPQCPDRTQAARLKLQPWLAFVLFLLVFGQVWKAKAQPVQPVSVIKVLVVFSLQAATNAGGTEAILRQIDFAAVEANTVFQNSSVNARIRLVQASQINYTESGSVASDLARLRNPADVVFARVHRLRNELGADLVCLITETGSDYSFYGLQGPSSENVFSILRRPYLTGSYYFPVTLSFNFGCQLERPYADSLGAFPYAYGYSFSTSNGFYSTVEAFSGQRLPYFSNPNIMFQGVPMGIPDGQFNAADNALVLNHTAPLVAGFRGSAVQTFPPTVKLIGLTNGAVFHGGDDVALKVDATDSDGRVVRVDYYATTNLVASSEIGAFTAIWDKMVLGQYSIFAVATDNKGASTVSDPIQITVRPQNDDFNSRTLIAGANASILANNAIATSEPGEPDLAGYPPSHSLWWSYVAQANGVVTLDATGSSFAASLDVYTGSKLDALTEVTSTIGSSESAVRFQVSAGRAYQISVDGPSGATGDILLKLDFANTPANDAFKHRQKLRGTVAAVNADNRGATLEPDEPTVSGTPGVASLWWSWTAPAKGQASFTVSSSNSATFLVGVFTGNVLTNLTPVLDQWVQAGTTYQIAVESPADPLATGPFVLNLNFTPEPVNDNFAGRTTISGTDISLTISSLLAVTDPGTPYPFFPTLWWSWTAPITGYVTVGGPSSQYMYVFTGTNMTNLTSVASQWPAVSFEATARTTYVIAANGPVGEIQINLLLSTMRLNSPTNGAIVLVGQNLPLDATWTGNDGELTQIEYFANGSSLGVSANAPFSLVWTNVPQGSFDLSVVGTDSDGNPRPSPSVSIRVQYPEPPNDDFTNRTVITGTWIGITNNNSEATMEPGEPNIGGAYWDNSIWSSWTAPASGTVTITTTAAPSSVAFGVYTGTVLTNLVQVASAFGGVSFEAVAGTVYTIGGVSWYGNVQFQLILSNFKIANPADGSSFIVGANVPIGTIVTATEQPVSQVEFFENGTSLDVVYSPPYSMIWSNPVGGAYTLTAVCTDDNGHTRTSPTVSISVQPSNDYFTNAIQLTGNTVHTNGSVAGATWKPGDPLYYNTYWGTDQGSGVVWYSWTAPQTGLRSIAYTRDWTFNPLFAVYTGTDADSLTLVTNDPGWSINYLSATSGVTYFIALDGGNPPGDAGNFTLDLTIPPTNDNFANRITITNANTMIYGNNLGAGQEPGEPNLSFYSVWWAWTAPQSGLLSFTIPDSFGPTLHVYSGSSISNLSLLPGQYGYLWDNIRNLRFEVVAGTTYTIEGDFQWSSDWSIEFMPVFQPRPANDNFTNSFVLTGMSASTKGNNSLATRESGEPNNGGSTAGHSVWYTWTAPAQGSVAITVSSTNFTPALAVYSGTAFSNFTTVGTAGPGGISFMTTAGASYNIAVDGSGGVFTLNISLTLPPPNDNFASRMTLSGLNATAMGSTYLATFQPGEIGFPLSGLDGSVWYSWTAPATGIAHASCSSNPVQVFTGNSISNLTFLAPANLASFNDVVFSVIAGNEYEIDVGGASNPSADFILSITMAKAQITSPTNGSFFPAPATFVIETSTINVDGSVVSIVFFDNTNLIATVTNLPFQITYSNVPQGSHMLSVQATDENGLTTTSEVVEVRSQPFNDDFAQRFTIPAIPATIVAANDGATTEPSEQLPGGATGRTLWWTWTAINDGTVTVNVARFNPPSSTSTPLVVTESTSSLQSSDLITIYNPFGPSGPTVGPLVSIYTNSVLTNLSLCASNSGFFPSIVIDSFNGSSSASGEGQWYILPSFSFPVVAGQTYQISLDGVNGSYGAASMNFYFTPASTPPANDNFANRIALTGSLPSANGTSVLATREPGEPLHGADTNARTVWYSWTAPASGDAQLSEADSFGFFGWSSSLIIAVYVGSQLNELTPVVLGGGGVSFYAQVGTTYQIAIVGPEGLGTGFVMGFSEAPPPPPVIDSSQSIMLHERGFQISIVGITGQSFVIEASSDLIHWETIWTDTIISSNFVFTDAEATTLPRRFYRTLPLEAIYYQSPLVLQAEPMQSKTEFSFTMTGTAGQVYLIQASTNLVDWIDLTNGTLSGDTLNFTDPDAALFDRRFYRAVKQ